MTTADLDEGSVAARAARELEHDCETFLKLEAEYLDDRRFEDWFQLLDAEITYEVPVRTTRENWDGSGISTTAFFMKEDLLSLETRVKRLASRFAWAESPATRTRRMMSTVRAEVGPDQTKVMVRSNIAIFCYKGDAAHPQIVTADRRDELRITAGGIKLLRRVAILDSSVLGLEALSIFL
jgi:3-phenylpropionate/cinnamic acid dioxygenase small subunit